MEIAKPTPEVIRQAVTELNHPVIFRNIIDTGENWNSLGLEKLKRILGDLEMIYRIGRNARTTEPQWDLECLTKSMTISQFLDKLEEDKEGKNWYYFDYKYMREWFNDKPEILSAVDWSPFGFDQKGEDSTLWIGSRGAHTNCHQDAYGCNLVAQIEGKKQWLLFPPHMNNALHETRIPYEESTIYTKFNLFCPSQSQEEELVKMQPPIRVVVKPGEVLFVPKGWWHYVESLDLSISVNIWLPLDTDYEARLKEALVKLIVKKIGDGVPAVEEDFYCTEELMGIIKKCKEDCEKAERESKNVIQDPKTKKIKRIPWTSEDLAQKYPDFVRKLDFQSPEEFSMFVKNQRERFPEEAVPGIITKNSRRDNDTQKMLQLITRTFCHSDVVTKIVELLLKKEVN